MVINSILEVVGNTPLLKLNKIIKKYDLKANLYAKLEYLNPTGSVKDRTALYIIEQAKKQAKLGIRPANIFDDLCLKIIK